MESETKWHSRFHDFPLKKVHSYVKLSQGAHRPLTDEEDSRRSWWHVPHLISSFSTHEQWGVISMNKRAFLGDTDKASSQNLMKIVREKWRQLNRLSWGSWGACEIIEGSLEAKLPTMWRDENAGQLGSSSDMEKVRREKMHAREKVGKSRNTLFFQCFVAQEGRRVGSLKRLVRR